MLTLLAALRLTLFVPTTALPVTLMSLPAEIATESAEIVLPSASVVVVSSLLCTLVLLATPLW
nr:hypothetical protein [Burkholderia sp. WAC0059]